MIGSLSIILNTKTHQLVTSTHFTREIKKAGGFTLIFLFAKNKDSSLTPGLESPLR